jgi:hypothetical protein
MIFLAFLLTRLHLVPPHLLSPSHCAAATIDLSFLTSRSAHQLLLVINCTRGGNRDLFPGVDNRELMGKDKDGKGKGRGLPQPDGGSEQREREWKRKRQPKD